jgi:dipeptidyl aminopeptidase/acylaminoacyl peptidase
MEKRENSMLSFNEEELLEYLKVKSAYQSQAVPGTDKFTFISKLTGIPQVYTLNEAQQPIPYVKLSDRPLSIHHSPNGCKSVIGMDQDGNEKQQIYLYDNETNEVELIVFSPSHFHYIGGWSHDGNNILYSSNRRGPGFFDVFVYDIVEKKSKEVFRYDGNCRPLEWISIESVLIQIQETNIDSGIYSVNINTNEKVRIGDDRKSARYQSLITKNGQKGYLLTDLGSDTLYLGCFSLESPALFEKLVYFEKWDIEEIAVSPNEEWIAFSLNEGGISKLWLYNSLTNQKLNIGIIYEGVIESLSWLNENEFVFVFKSPTMPGDIWKFSCLTNKVERQTYIGQSEKIGHQWKEQMLCSFTSFDGLEVPYFFYDQDNKNKKPAVIYVHGGPEGQTKAEYHPVMQYLVQQGFAVAAPNVRGSMGYGRTYVQLDDARKRMDSVQDLAWLVKDLVETHGVDPNRIGIMGRSYGGFMVLAAMTHYPDLWAAGVNIVGISNFNSFLKNTGEWRRRLRECEYGFLEDHHDFFDEISPLRLSSQIKAPLLVFHGRNDTRVPVSEAEQLVAEMKTRNQEVEFIVFEDEGHQTEKLNNHITMNQKTLEFFGKYLG